MSSYNEEDIIQESIQKLIQQGIDVILIDNGSTDSTVNKAMIYLNRGLINIEECKYFENGREVYDWSKLLQRKQDISKSLNYSWYMHVDADEIRYSPWQGVSLADGINIVDQMGYNLINFKLFNFKLTKKLTSSDSFEERLKFYAKTEVFNRMQVKAWKRDDNIDLVSHGGHLALINNPKIFPIRFIHKHYPIRSVEQGKRKILRDRLNRYSESDRKKGWHVQYDHFKNSDINIESLIELENDTLNFYQHEEVVKELLVEALQISSVNIDILHSQISYGLQNDSYIESKIKEKFGVDLISEIKTIAKYVENIIKQSMMIDPQIIENKDLKDVVFDILKAQALKEYLNGDPLFWDGLAPLRETI